MTEAAKSGDPVIGIDIHLVGVPAPRSLGAGSHKSIPGEQTLPDQMTQSDPREVAKWP
jgi:hypothetical protein